MEDLGTEKHIKMQKVPKETKVHTEPQSFTRGSTCRLSQPETLRLQTKHQMKPARKLCGLIGFCLILILVEIVGGIKANSLAVVGDAVHLLIDVAGFSISLFAIWASAWEATPHQSFGFFRLEVLGALLSIQLIWLVAGILIYEAIMRILHRNVAVNGKLMFMVATFGFIVNLTMIMWLGHNHTRFACGSKAHGMEDVETTEGEKVNLISSLPGEHRCNVEHSQIHNCSQDKMDSKVLKEAETYKCHMNLNLQGAYLHVLGDLIQSIGVMIGGAIIWAKPEWLVVDLICTIVFCMLVLYTTASMLRSVISILMESTPDGINVDSIETGLKSIEGVQDIHDLHLWAISMGKNWLICHVIAEPGASSNETLLRIRDYCERIYRINHVTIQIEQE
ncbi:metal tolerance protein 1-like [Telopea speciosissima]|uniref:metal tolerance protein 1-like n=1 Tax=Telopea speciosissima TaxID=54955 RepID=UPI001CC81F7D|nr:metal tolerance protein 1-like [Telopea speciosissima]